jgi:hypothetical protein
MTVLCVNAQRQKPCCSVACLKVSLIGAENKGETACLRAKSHVPAHLIQAPPHARVFQALLPLLLSARDASSPRKRFQASLIHSKMHVPSFSPYCVQRARNTEGGCPRPIQLPLTPPSAARAFRSSPSERGSEGPKAFRPGPVPVRGSVPNCPCLRIPQLAKSQGRRGIAPDLRA